MLEALVMQACCALNKFLKDATVRRLDPIRVARSACSLLQAGVGPSVFLFKPVIDLLLENRHLNGGWSDPDETAWALSTIVLSRIENNDGIEMAQQWLDRVHKPSGGWGRHDRDCARIPTTGLVAALVPDVFRSEDVTWMLGEWGRDWCGPVRLSYKAGFFLLAMPEGNANALVELTLAHLAEDQNDDGGFGPWKNHPIGSDPWSTGVVLWGLSRWIHMVDKSVIHRALAWLERTQLPSGYWPYHYLDDGTSLALIGAVAAMKALASAE